MSRLLVTGGSGLLGSSIAYLGSTRFEAQLTYLAHPVTIRNCRSVKMDLRDPEGVRRVVEDFRPQVIVHTAALLPAKLCEEDPKLAQAVHVDGVRYLASTSKKVGARLIHISTDWIFDGQKECYNEDDPPNPLNEYGRSKLKGEKVVQESGVDHCIIRTSLYGWNLRRDKFCYPEMVLERLARMEEFQAPDDQFFAPLLVNILAEAIFEICAKGISGILNVTGTEAISRYHFCRTVAEVFGLNKELIKPVPISPGYFGVLIPKHQSLDVTKAKGLLKTKLPNIYEGLLEMKHLRDSGYVTGLREEERSC